MSYQTDGFLKSFRCNNELSIYVTGLITVYKLSSSRSRIEYYRFLLPLPKLYRWETENKLTKMGCCCRNILYCWNPQNHTLKWCLFLTAKFIHLNFRLFRKLWNDFRLTSLRLINHIQTVSHLSCGWVTRVTSCHFLVFSSDNGAAVDKKFSKLSHEWNGLFSEEKLRYVKYGGPL